MRVSRVWVSLLALTLATGVQADEFTVKRDLLPFGIPDALRGADDWPLLSRDDLLSCVVEYRAVETARLDLGVKVAKLRLDEIGEQLIEAKRQPVLPKDELDRQLDQIEAKDRAEQLPILVAARLFSQERAAFFQNYREFIDRCAFRIYRVEDLESLIKQGVK